MGKIFLGLIFIMLDFNLESGSSVIGLIPDFIGYFLVVAGLRKIESESSTFHSALILAYILLPFSVVCYVWNVLGLGSSINIVGFVLTILSVAGNIYMAYLIMKGILDIERNRNIDLKGNKLQSMWITCIVADVVFYLAAVFPGAALFFAIFSAVANIMFLVAFRNTKNLYDIYYSADL